MLFKISELIQLRLLHRTGQAEKIDSSTVLKCNLNLEAADRLAKDLGFSLRDLLWENPE